MASPADVPRGGFGRCTVGGIEGGDALQHGVNVVGDGAVLPACLRELVQRDDAVFVEVERLARKSRGDNGRKRYYTYLLDQSMAVCH